MPQHNVQKEWEHYKDKELAKAVPLLNSLGFEIEEAQPHLLGERYLMQAVTRTSGKKLVLLGTRKKDKKRAVIKVTSDSAGKRELEHEHTSRNLLQNIKFAYQVFSSPEELLFTTRGGMTISAQTFLQQKCAFLERSIEEQFMFALKAFKAQEGAHATTYGHIRLIKKTFGSMDSKDYIRTFEAFVRSTMTYVPDLDVLETLNRGKRMLEEHEKTIEQYSGFLTHIDFVPHNFRIVDSNIYLLDHSAMRFGNKHEGWARFVNFMELYNSPLAKALVEYIQNNRTEEESHSLTLMRIYRLGELICYYVQTLDKSQGDLHTLNQKRISFWKHVLEAVLSDTPISTKVVEAYKKERDRLRSEEEKVRQIDLH